MSTITERVRLDERRHQLLAQAREKFDSITEDTAAERRAELETEHDKLMGDVDNIDKSIERLVRIEAAEKAAEERAAAREEEVAAARRPGVDSSEPVLLEGVLEETADTRDAAEQSEYREIFYHKILRGLPLSDTERENRYLGVGTDTAGGYLVPEMLQSNIIETMKAYGPFNMGSPAHVIQTSGGGKMPFPTINDTSQEAVILAENTQAAQQDVVYGEKDLEAFKLSSKMIRVSTELMQDSIIQPVENHIAKILGERLGRGVNKFCTTGSGSSQPNGVVTAATAGKTTAAATAITFDEVLDLLHSVDPAYRMGANTGFMLHDNVLLYLRKLKDSENRYLWQMGDVRQGEPNTLWGQKYWINQHMDSSVASAKKTLLYGDFSQFYIRKVSGMEIYVSHERYIEWHQTAILGMCRIDSELMDTAAVKVMTQA